jgi:hypothetical protein
MSVTVDTSVRVYDDFNRLQFLHSHWETSALTNELPQGSDEFRFLRATCVSNLEGSVGLIWTKVSDMRISIPVDLSSHSLGPYSITEFHSLETFYSTFKSFPSTLSSMSFLSDTCWVFTLEFYRLLYSG